MIPIRLTIACLLCNIFTGLFLWVGPVAADEFDNVMQALETYYRSQEQQDLDAYLAVQYFATENEKQRERLFAGTRWKNAALSRLSLGPAQVSVNESGTEALVRFRVGYRVTLTQTGESFPYVAQNVAMLINRGGWRIRRLGSQADFTTMPQAVDEETLRQLEEDHNLYAQLTASTSGPSSPHGNSAGAAQKAAGSNGDNYGQEVDEIALDFESGDLRNWEKTGDAFDFQPTLGDNPTGRHRSQPSGHQGDYWIGTFEKRPDAQAEVGAVQGDRPQGTLSSVPFILCNDSLSFLIGGGCQINDERVELLVNEEVVRQATGSCSESMQRVQWDVSPWSGQAARVRIVDAGSGSWGHINFDDLRSVCVESSHSAVAESPTTPGTPPANSGEEPSEPPTQEPGIVDSGSSGGIVNKIYLVDELGKDTPLQYQTSFSGKNRQIVVQFDYHDLEPGDVLTGVWTDVGRKLKLQVFPIVVSKGRGTTGFTIQRPLSGWAPGFYSIEISKDNDILNVAEFVIENE